MKFKDLIVWTICEGLLCNKIGTFEIYVENQHVHMCKVCVFCHILLVNLLVNMFCHKY
jgi:hypothetical protein